MTNSDGLRNLNNCDFETATLKVNMVISEGTKQTVIHEKFSVPDSKPDVGKILSTKESAKVKKVEVLRDKVVVNGILHLQVVYVAFKPDQSVHSMFHKLPFTTFIDLPGVEPGMDVDVKVMVEDVSVTPAPDCARDFDVAAVLQVTAKATEPREVDVAVRAQPNMQVETERLKVEHLIANAKKQIIVSESFKIPREKPDVQEVIDIDTEVTILNKKIIKDKVVFDGEVDLSILYVAMKPEMPVHDLHKVIKFSDFVEVPGAEKDMNVEIKAVVENVNVEPTAGDACKLDADIVLSINVYVTESRTVDVITDVDTDECNVTRTNLKVDHLVGEATTQVIVKDISAPPHDMPDVEDVIDCRLENLDIKDVDIISGKVIVRGTVEILVVYTAMKDNKSSVHTLHRKLNFRTFVEIPGAQEDMDVEVKPVLEYCNCQTDTGCNVKCEAVLKITVRVTETMDRSVVTGAEPNGEVEPEEFECPAGTEEISYTIKAGDTLYNIARRYNTTVDAILEANEDLNLDPNNLQIGTVITVCAASAPKG
ncbi:DUF3794 and LysM peptidoglycan-binding domain-containing protein [Desulfolucanica intricata]|uniref:DUF3794 and LysM peptidoglycan-binding domain-containing protein n=1 Tax=Desulfolucanica intricata TaxID=1285191 RepID=UPI0008319FE2|nr:SPOCS domain-containing protein [Desulfolucanica intricata]